MSRPPAVSVILAVCNAEATIAEAVESVLAQSHGDFELIVIDDGSTDGTAQVLARLRDSRMRVLHFENAGPSRSRNRGIQVATGSFVACIDADDIWMPTKLERQLAALEQNPLAGVAHGWTDFVDADGHFVCADQRPTLAGDVYAMLLRQNFISSGSNTMMRRDLVIAVGGFDEDLLAVEDWELHVRLSRRAHFASVPEVVVRYRLRPDSLTSQTDVMERAFRLASDKIFAAAPDELRHLRRPCRASFFFYLAVRAMQRGDDSRRWLRAARLLGIALGNGPLQTIKRVARGSPTATLKVASGRSR